MKATDKMCTWGISKYLGLLPEKNHYLSKYTSYQWLSFRLNISILNMTSYD